MEEAEGRLRKAEMAAETATALAQKSLQQTMQGKLSVSVLAPSVKVSFGAGNDLTVMPDAPKDLIEKVGTKTSSTIDRIYRGDVRTRSKRVLWFPAAV